MLFACLILTVDRRETSFQSPNQQPPKKKWWRHFQKVPADLCFNVVPGRCPGVEIEHGTFNSLFGQFLAEGVLQGSKPPGLRDGDDYGWSYLPWMRLGSWIRLFASLKTWSLRTCASGVCVCVCDCLILVAFQSLHLPGDVCEKLAGSCGNETQSLSGYEWFKKSEPADANWSGGIGGSFLFLVPHTHSTRRPL